VNVTVSPTLAFVCEYGMPACHEIGMSFDGEGLLLGTDDGDGDGSEVGLFGSRVGDLVGEVVGDGSGTPSNKSEPLKMDGNSSRLGHTLSKSASGTPNHMAIALNTESHGVVGIILPLRR